MGKYAKLADYFQGVSSDKNKVRLTFTDIERLIASTLPKSAHEHNQWWANSYTANDHDWPHLWLRAGWEKSAVDLLEEWVEFRRIQPPPTREFEQQPSDIAAPPDRIDVNVRRIIRDTVAAKSLKALYDYNCQVCGLRIESASGRYYVEVHHVRPLGGNHRGLDVHTNMLVLCPNHHAMFDFGIPLFVAADQITIGETMHTLKCKHRLTYDVIAYHNENIVKLFTNTDA